MPLDAARATVTPLAAGLVADLRAAWGLTPERLDETDPAVRLVAVSLLRERARPLRGQPEALAAEVTRRVRRVA